MENLELRRLNIYFFVDSLNGFWKQNRWVVTKNILKCTDSCCILINGLGTGGNIILTFSVTVSFILQKFERIALT